MKQEHLHLLLNEELYQIDHEQSGEVGEAKEDGKALPTKESETEIAAATEVEETPAKVQIATQQVTNEGSSNPAEVVPLAIFHQSSTPDDLDLLKKILAACKLAPGTYQVFDNGFDKEIPFKKALVFIEKAKVFYEAVPYKQSQILCSKPLNEVAGNQQDKAKLWNALQAFV